MRELPIDLDELISVIDQGSPAMGALELLSESVLMSDRLGDLGDELVDHYVRRARDAGASWSDVGSSLGVSKQAAQKRFVRRPPGFMGHRRRLFTRFSPSARTIVLHGVEAAHEFGSAEVETVHLVLGLTESPSPRMRELLEAGSTDLDDVRESAKVVLGNRTNGGQARGHIPFAAESKKVLELSLREAIHEESRHIRAEHILMGVLRDPRSSGAKLLNEHGVTLDAVKKRLSSIDEEE